jgi:hypothetical protein
MKCTYELTVETRCPVDPSTMDRYVFTIETHRFIEVEKILDFFIGQREAVFQEHLTAACAEKFGGIVKSVGVHSGVRTVCEAP